jgi:hypothetical protein
MMGGFISCSLVESMTTYLVLPGSFDSVGVDAATGVELAADFVSRVAQQSNIITTNTPAIKHV